MKFEFRVVEIQEGEKNRFLIGRVLIDATGEPEGYFPSPISICWGEGESIDELLRNVQAAIAKKPVRARDLEALSNSQLGHRYGEEGIEISHKHILENSDQTLNSHLYCIPAFDLVQLRAELLGDIKPPAAYKRRVDGQIRRMSQSTSVEEIKAHILEDWKEAYSHIESFWSGIVAVNNSLALYFKQSHERASLELFEAEETLELAQEALRCTLSQAAYEQKIFRVKELVELGVNPDLAAKLVSEICEITERINLSNLFERRLAKALTVKINERISS